MAVIIGYGYGYDGGYGRGYGRIYLFSFSTFTIILLIKFDMNIFD